MKFTEAMPLVCSRWTVHRGVVVGLATLLGAGVGATERGLVARVGPSKVIALSEATAAAKAELRELTAYLSGSFSSAAQASRDPDFLPIVLHMAPIWADRDDGPWLYVEQARAGADDRPYRQRVYRLVSESPGVVRSDVYTLPGATPEEVLKFAGAWKDPSRLSGVKPESLTLRGGCSLTLNRVVMQTLDGRPVIIWRGATKGTGCASDLRGAAYATSEAEITAERLVTLDRGFDGEGRQVWGSTKGGYEFVRQADPAGSSAPVEPKPASPSPAPAPAPKHP
jgi:hypothetical protein